MAGERGHCSRIRRAHFEGVLRVLLFNWPWYASSVAVVSSGTLVLQSFALEGWMKVAILLLVSCTLFWTMASLVVSHWVYDRSRLCRWDWIADQFPVAPARAVQIHAGHDETDGQLRRIFPLSHLLTWDIFDPDCMTESSITRARKLAPARLCVVPVSPAALPAVDAAFDAVFLVFAAHEIRSAKTRERLFGELRRVLRPGGSLLIVEHLRDWRNLVAYQGFCFLSRERAFGEQIQATT